MNISASHVNLSGFSIDFLSGPSDGFDVRQDSNGPSAAIGILAPSGTPLVDTEILDLTITIPYLAADRNYSNSPDYDGFVAIRTDPLTSGSIEDNTFQGQGININGGPWLIESNDYQGALSGTSINQAFSARDNVHDLVFENNRVQQAISGGETDKFFEIKGGTAELSYSLIQGNEIDGGLGESASSGSNTHEIILADNTTPYFIGTPTYVFSDGRVLQIGAIRGSVPPSPGLVVSIVSTNYTGAQRWYRVAQVIDNSTLIMQDPLPTPGDYYVSLNA